MPCAARWESAARDCCARSSRRACCWRYAAARWASAWRLASSRLLKTIGGHAIPRLDSVTTGWVVLLCGLGSAILAAVLAAVFPALRASRLDPIEVLKSAGPKSSLGRGERRLLRGVTMVQTALTLALLVGTGLLVRTMINLSKVPSGYRTSHILTATVTAVQGDWEQFHHMALERVSAIPGVRHAAFAWGVPLTGNNWPGELEIEGQPPAAKASDQILMPLRSVTPGYFELLGQAITRGRDFLPTDTRDKPGVAVVNQALVDRYFPHSDPLGKKLWGNGRQTPRRANRGSSRQQPHRRSDQGARAGSLPAAVAGAGIFQIAGCPRPRPTRAR